MSKWGWAARIGGYAAAPFTGGLSVMAGNAAANQIEKRQAANDGPGGGKHPEDQFTARLAESAENLRGVGKDAMAQGQDVLAPLLAYFKDIYGVDPSAALEATRAERGRVMDQYDTARTTIAQFGPRGGGQTGAMADANVAEGQALADVFSNARSQAREAAGSLGSESARLGLAAEGLASQDLNSVLNAILSREGLDVQKRGQNMQMWGDIGEAGGNLLGMWLGRDSAGGGGGGGGGFNEAGPLGARVGSTASFVDPDHRPGWQRILEAMSGPIYKPRNPYIMY